MRLLLRTVSSNPVCFEKKRTATSFLIASASPASRTFQRKPHAPIGIDHGGGLLGGAFVGLRGHSRRHRAVKVRYAMGRVQSG